jgi:glycerophosphoryl diester phosphodiesterase
LEYLDNSLEACVAAAKNGYGFEFDIRFTIDNEIVVFHDDDMEYLTGVKGLVKDKTLAEIQKLTYKQTIHDKTYTGTPKIPLMSQILQAACSLNPTVNINFDIKFDYTDERAQKLFDLIDSSPCLCDSSKQTFIFDSPFPWTIAPFKKMIKNRRCKGKFTFYIHPNTVPLDLYFWLKTRIAMGFGEIDIISSHWTVWDAHMDIFRQIEKDGFCTSIYGDYEDKLKKYNPTASIVPDISPASFSYAEYTPVYFVVNIFDLLMFMGVTSFILALLLFVSFIKGWIFPESNKTDDVLNEEQTNLSANEKKVAVS